MLKSASIAAIAFACLVTPSNAGPRLADGCNVLWPCVAPYASTPEQARLTHGKYIARAVGFGAPVVKRHRKPRQAHTATGHVHLASAQIVSHPSGCPARSFCGCGAAVRVFGRPVRNLWLAANWFRFPRTSPSAGMVAVRRHHVFVLEAHLGGNTWLAFDANSGGHRTRIHPRSIAGYVIVNPHRSG